MNLEFIWFSAFVILATGYAILDGFDLGVGMLHLLPRKDEDRRSMLNTIGPVWDGNEVWLVTAGGALFAGFPDVYATLASAFYIPLMALLAVLIFRAVAIEFRSKNESMIWRWTFDVLFAGASLFIAMGLGLVLGNLIRGIPLDEHKEFIGSIEDLLNPYALLVAIFTASVFCMHGAIYSVLKTEGELQKTIESWIRPSIITFIILYAVTTISTLIFMPHMIETLRERPIFLLVSVINILAIANVPREITHKRPGRAFISSCVNIVCLLALYGIGTYPNAIRAINDPQNLSLTIYNSASSEKTLGILLFIAIIGIPLVLSYTIAIYYIFRGKTRLDASSY
ncbi:MAG: cytochrome d ubiquinol oxidase subunit II [Parachlamydiaceae bacterium]